MKTHRFYIMTLIVLVTFAMISCDSGQLNREEELILYGESIAFVDSFPEDGNYLYSEESTGVDLQLRNVDGVFQMLDVNGDQERYFLNGTLYTWNPDTEDYIETACAFESLDYQTGPAFMMLLLRRLYASPRLTSVGSGSWGLSGEMLGIEVDLDEVNELYQSSEFDSVTLILMKYGPQGYVINLTAVYDGIVHTLKISEWLLFDELEFPDNLPAVDGE